jgi:hypothetical protein
MDDDIPVEGMLSGRGKFNTPVASPSLCTLRLSANLLLPNPSSLLSDGRLPFDAETPDIRRVGSLGIADGQRVVRSAP